MDGIIRTIPVIIGDGHGMIRGIILIHGDGVIRIITHGARLHTMAPDTITLIFLRAIRQAVADHTEEQAVSTMQQVVVCQNQMSVITRPAQQVAARRQVHIQVQHVATSTNRRQIHIPQVRHIPVTEEVQAQIAPK